MKVSKLEGGLLAYWVGRAADLQVVPVSTGNGKFVCMTCTVDGDLVLVNRNHYRPHEDWVIGGPIIECEQMNIGPDIGETWSARQYGGEGEQLGQTLLIAAMRCYVGSKFGDEVPDAID